MFDVFCEAIGFFDFLFFAIAILVFLIILVVVGTIIGGLALIYFGLPALLGDANFLSLPSLWSNLLWNLQCCYHIFFWLKEMNKWLIIMNTQNVHYGNK